MREMEYKRMLDETGYAAVAQWMDSENAPAGFVQINYFYDTGGYDLHRSDVTLRVRQADGKLKCQCKYAAGDAGGAADESHLVRIELEKTLETLPAAIDPAKLFDDPRVACLPKAGLIGALVTERRVCQVTPGVDIMLDRSHYLGHTDWELEIEYVDGKARDAREWCDRLCPRGGDVIGKRVRFIRAHRALFV